MLLAAVAVWLVALQGAAALWWSTAPEPAGTRDEVGVRVRLEHPWFRYGAAAASSAWLLELLEGAGEQWPQDFFALLSEVWAPHGLPQRVRVRDVPGLASVSPAAMYDATEAVVTEFAQRRGVPHDALAAQMDEWRLSASLHLKAAKVEADFQLFNTSAHPDVACASYVEWQGKFLCGEEEHAILYVDPFSTNIRALHTTLMHLADTLPEMQYVLRWRPSRAHASTFPAPRHLSGFRVALNVKKVDYLVLDDRELHADAAGPFGPGAPASHAWATYRALEERLWGGATRPASVQAAVAQQANMTQEGVRRLAYAAAGAALTSEDPLVTLEELVNNFPAHAMGLAHFAAHTPHDSPVFRALGEMQNTMWAGGEHYLWMNGLPLTREQFAPLELARLLRTERRRLAAFATPELGLAPADAAEILMDDRVNAAFEPSDAARSRLYDASDRAEGIPVVAWANDLEDGSYAEWPSSMQSLLAPRWPGSLPMLARNLIRAVLIPDMQRADAFGLLAQVLDAAVGRYSMQWGVVPLVGASPDDAVLAQALCYALAWLPRADAAALCAAVAAEPRADGAPDAAVARRELQRRVRTVGRARADAELQAFLGDAMPSDAAAQRLAATRRYLRRLGVRRAGAGVRAGTPGALGAAFVGGFPVSFSDAIVREAVGVMRYLTQAATSAVAEGVLDDDGDVSHFFYDLPNTAPSRSLLVSMLEGAAPPGTAAPFYVDLPRAFARVAQCGGARAPEGGAGAGVEAAARAPSAATSPERTALHDLLYSADDARVNVTVRVVGDLCADSGAHVVRAVVEAARAAPVPFRAAFVHVGAADCASAHDPLPVFLCDAQRSGVLHTVPPDALAHALAAADVRGELSALLAAHGGAPTPGAATCARDFAAAAGIDAAACTLLINGQALLIADADDVTADEIRAAVAWEGGTHAAALLATAGMRRAHGDAHADAVELALALVGAALTPPPGTATSEQNNARMQVAGVPQRTAAAFTIGDTASAASVVFTAVLDPLADDAPGLLGAVRMLSEMHGVRVVVVLNPRPRLTSVPLQCFSAMQARPRPVFDARGAEAPPEASFAVLPQQSVLTMQMDAPRTLVTMAHTAVYDLDNIQLDRLQGVAARAAGVQVVYGVTGVLMEGHARDAHGAAPRGLQLVLRTADGAQHLDTIIMENLGYFQFRAQPGRWLLAVRAGRSAELYTLASIGAPGALGAPVADTGAGIVLDDALGVTLYPLFERRPGTDALLLVDEHGGAGAALGAAASRRHPPVNIFTLASGHLYERMTYIMILSVLRNTQSHVKFWFVENFLSPSFKAFIPELAREYGFAYELITFAWPRWLREQTEKQRLIWAYKILFLDVLFPLDLDRVIFVDADQIVRADLQELVDMDLAGAPYGYPPMGDDSEDMDGFRFWKQGYWSSFLRGRPYHISALYVVDLHRFRAMGAGDILRRSYQSLTVDRNSLANLDQDLPNHLQFRLPIFTLDKTWLWCETWCSHDWLPDAKTIDLCSNPKTKEPKLDRARRQIPEWNVYDDEVTQFARRVAAGGIAEATHGSVGGEPSASVAPVRGDPTARVEPAHDEL
ncbi:killer toxin resistant protein [Malassezia sp. CBS 17886]|nr:killer toxin resistant protein [Malassezia sp. CBS 17886]